MENNFDRLINRVRNFIAYGKTEAEIVALLTAETGDSGEAWLIYKAALLIRPGKV